MICIMALETTLLNVHSLKKHGKDSKRPGLPEPMSQNKVGGL